MVNYHPCDLVCVVFEERNCMSLLGISEKRESLKDGAVDDCQWEEGGREVKVN